MANALSTSTPSPSARTNYVILQNGCKFGAVTDLDTAIDHGTRAPSVVLALALYKALLAARPGCLAEVCPADDDECVIAAPVWRQLGVGIEPAPACLNGTAATMPMLAPEQRISRDKALAAALQAGYTVYAESDERSAEVHYKGRAWWRITAIADPSDSGHRRHVQIALCERDSSGAPGLCQMTDLPWPDDDPQPVAIVAEVITDIGPRPSNPAEISFAPECFADAGVEVRYVVVRAAGHSGPLVTTDEDEALDYARRTGREVIREETPVRRRTRWTA